MDRQQIHEAALAQHVVPQALDQVVARVQAHFGDAQPSPQALSDYIGGLDVWDKIGMEKQEFLGKPGTWQMDQAHVVAPPPAGFHSRRPKTRSLTPTELAAHNEQAALEGWSKAYATERARVLQQTPLPPQP